MNRLTALAVLLGMMAVMTSIAAPRINLSQIRLNGALREVASALASAKSKAILKQHDVILVFDQDESAFRVLLDQNNNASADDGEQVTTVPLSEATRFGLGGAPSLTGESTPVTFSKRVEGLPSLSFHRNGSASEEGVIYLTSARAEGGGSPEDTRAITIDRGTGQLRCMSYSSLEWKRGC